MEIQIPSLLRIKPRAPRAELLQEQAGFFWLLSCQVTLFAKVIGKVVQLLPTISKEVDQLPVAIANCT